MILNTSTATFPHWIFRYWISSAEEGTSGIKNAELWRHCSVSHKYNRMILILINFQMSVKVAKTSVFPLSLQLWGAGIRVADRHRHKHYFCYFVFLGDWHDIFWCARSVRWCECAHLCVRAHVVCVHVRTLGRNSALHHREDRGEIINTWLSGRGLGVDSKRDSLILTKDYTRLAKQAELGET